MIDAARTPVIAGLGEIIDRPATLDDALEPIDLMVQAMRRADTDAGGGLLRRIDSLDVVNQISWPYAAPADLMCERLGIAPARRSYGAVGGETPLAFIQQACRRIGDGRSSIAAICGGEAHHSVAAAAKAGFVLPWTARATDPAPSIRGQDLARPAARRLGLHLPVTVYPLFETAQAARWHQTPAEAIAESAALWERFGKVAAGNASAAIRTPPSATDIARTSASNRMIAWPYTKLMVANIAVNQAAAIIITSLAVARSAGLDDGRLVFVLSGNVAEEPAHIVERADLARCPARDVVLEDALATASSGFDAVELYSCFPCVPKAAMRTLGLDLSTTPTVTGGLTFFGAPLNNYMTHATAAMVRRLRAASGVGLLYGQGGFATKHRTLTLASTPGGGTRAFERDLQGYADRRRSPAPVLADDAIGTATVEAFTVIHGRSDERHGAIVARGADGRRRLARVPGDDDSCLRTLESPACSAVGRSGSISAEDGDPVLRWRFEHA